MQTILIVEDDKTIAESICFILEKDSFNCKWFDNGSDAIEFHKDNEVDLILLDVGLPDMSGFISGSPTSNKIRSTSLSL